MNQMNLMNQIKPTYYLFYIPLISGVAWPKSLGILSLFFKNTLFIQKQIEVM
jgi:hypothetical protein